MNNEKYLKQAQTVYETLCRTFDSRGWAYKKDTENWSITCQARGEDLPMDFIIRVDVNSMMIRLASVLPFTVPEDKRTEIAVAVSMINSVLIDGSFDYDIRSGNMFFRMTNSFLESLVGNDLIGYMFSCAYITVDAYNDKFLMLVKGMMTLQQFVDSLQK